MVRRLPVYQGEPSWEHGYPRAEQNLMAIMAAVTALNPHVEDSMVMSIEDPQLSKYAVAFMTEAGFWSTNDKEAGRSGRPCSRAASSSSTTSGSAPGRRGLGELREQHGACDSRRRVGAPQRERSDLSFILRHRRPQRAEAEVLQRTAPQFLGLYENDVPASACSPSPTTMSTSPIGGSTRPGLSAGGSDQSRLRVRRELRRLRTHALEVRSSKFEIRSSKFGRLSSDARQFTPRR